MTDRELMQQALEKLEFFAHMKSVSEDTTRLITRLRERLAQNAARTTDRGPVAWLPPDPPPECKSEAEMTAFAFGWFKALETQRLAQPEQKTCLVANESCKHGSWCSEVYCQEHCKFVEQEPVDIAEEAGAYMDARLWEFIDMAAAWPEAKPDPRTWSHVMVYAPKPAWRAHVEQRLRTWRQSFVNKSGDQLALDDFMDKRSLDDLIDFVCDEYTDPQPVKFNCTVVDDAHPEGVPLSQWHGLTDQEINSVCYKRDWTAPWTDTTFARAIEQALKEKNT